MNILYRFIQLSLICKYNKSLYLKYALKILSTTFKVLLREMEGLAHVSVMMEWIFIYHYILLLELSQFLFEEKVVFTYTHF